jgi:HEAT repeat protein
MVWRKVTAMLVLIGLAGLTIKVTQPFLRHTSSANQPVNTVDATRGKQTSGLIPELLDDNAAIREQAFKKLQALDESVSVAELSQALKDEDWQIRVIAAYTLGRLGVKADSVVSELNSTIEDENADVRIAAAQALGNIGSEKVVPGLIKALQDKDEDVRVSAAEALSKLGETAKPAGSALTKALWDGNSFVRRYAIKTLLVLGPDSIDIPVLVEPLRDSRDPENGAIISLMIGIYPAILEKPELCSQFFVKALQSKDPSVRESAAVALGQIRLTQFAVYDSQSVTDTLLLALKDQDPKVRSSVAQALGRVASSRTPAEAGIAETRSALLTMFNDEDSQVRSSAAEGLGNTVNNYNGVPKAAPVLAKKIVSETAKLLKDKDAKVRQNAIYILRQIIREDFPPSLKAQLNPSIYSYLVDALDDTDEGVRQKALATLSLLYKRDKQYAVDLFSQLIALVESKDVDKKVRRSLLAYEGSRSAYEGSRLAHFSNGRTALNNALQDEDLGVQQHAALSLYKAELINSETAIDVLSKGLRSDDPLTQLDALNGLSQMMELDKTTSTRVQAEFPRLNRCLQSPTNPVQWAAALTINKADPKQEATIPALRDMLETESDWALGKTALDALEKIDSPQAVLAMNEAFKPRNQEFKYARTCSDGYEISLSQKQRVLLIESLKKETTRQILAEELSGFHDSDSLENRNSNQNATVDALLLLLQKENGDPALQPVLELKSQDVRVSAAYVMGSFLLKDKKDETANQKVINALTKIMNDSSDNLDVRRIAATSLQKAGIDVKSFFENNELVNPEKIQCPFPTERMTSGLKFDTYEGRCIYNKRVGCGQGLAEVYSTLRSLLTK